MTMHAVKHINSKRNRPLSIIIDECKRQDRKC